MQLLELFEHHNWANEMYISFVKTLDENTYAEPLPGSDKTIHSIIYHLTEVIWHWYKRMNPEYGGTEPDHDLPTRDLVKDLSTLQSEVMNWAKNADLSRSITIQWDTDHKPVPSTPENMIQNFIVHSAYHRGQLALLLRFHGFTSIEETDVNPYLYDLGQL